MQRDHPEDTPTGGDGPDGLPAWSACEVFCIHSYAGEAGPACGWRGRLREAALDAKLGKRRCPRCGRATLMPLG